MYSISYYQLCFSISPPPLCFLSLSFTPLTSPPYVLVCGVRCARILWINRRVTFLSPGSRSFRLHSDFRASVLRAGFRRALRPSDWTHFIFTRQHRRHTSSLSSSSLPLAPPFPFILLIQSVIFNLLPLLASELQTSLEMFLVKSAPVSRSSSFSSPYLSDVLKRMSPQHQTTKQDADPSTVYARL